MNSASEELAFREELKEEGRTQGFFWKEKEDFVWKGEVIPSNFADILNILGQEWIEAVVENDFAINPPGHETDPMKINYDGPIDLKAEILKAQAAEPMEQLRLERNWKLEESDWMAVGDRTPTKAQKDYRQALRDLPATATPTLDAKGWLDNDSFDWPTKP